LQEREAAKAAAEAKAVAAMAEKEAMYNAIADKIAKRVTAMAGFECKCTKNDFTTAAKVDCPGAPVITEQSQCMAGAAGQGCTCAWQGTGGITTTTGGDTSTTTGAPSSSTTGGTSSGKKDCFARDTTACFLASPLAECEHVLMADLAVGDLVLGREGATRVLANQHKAVESFAEMLTFVMADGATVSMTPTHGLWVDGTLAAAADVKVGSLVTNAQGESVVVKRIATASKSIINPVTADGTIIASGILAASNPSWIAALTVDAPVARAVVNTVLYAVGDVDSIEAGCAKVTAAIAIAAIASKLLKSRAASK